MRSKRLSAIIVALCLAILLATTSAFGQHRRHAPHRVDPVSSGYYMNSVGHRVHRPIVSRSVPAGASARVGTAPTVSVSTGAAHARITASSPGGSSVSVSRHSSINTATGGLMSAMRLK
jgi:hypothetical protein